MESSNTNAQKQSMKKQDKTKLFYFLWPFLCPFLVAYLACGIALFLKAMSVVQERGIKEVSDNFPRLFMQAIESSPPPSELALFLLFPLSTLNFVWILFYAPWILLSIYWYKRPHFVSGILLFVYTFITVGLFVFSLMSYSLFSTR